MYVKNNHYENKKLLQDKNATVAIGNNDNAQ